jgi:hypothetical protein
MSTNTQPEWVNLLRRANAAQVNLASKLLKERETLSQHFMEVPGTDIEPKSDGFLTTAPAARAQPSQLLCKLCEESGEVVGASHALIYPSTRLVRQGIPGSRLLPHRFSKT